MMMQECLAQVAATARLWPRRECAQQNPDLIFFAYTPIYMSNKDVYSGLLFGKPQ